PGSRLDEDLSSLQQPFPPEVLEDLHGERSDGQEEKRLGHEHEEDERVGAGVKEEGQREESAQRGQAHRQAQQVRHARSLRHRDATTVNVGCAGPWHSMQEFSPDSSLGRSSLGWPSDLRNFCDSRWQARQRLFGYGWAILRG